MPRGPKGEKRPADVIGAAVLASRLGLELPLPGDCYPESVVEVEQAS
jgi:hypothetical protein